MFHQVIAVGDSNNNWMFEYTNPDEAATSEWTVQGEISLLGNSSNSNDDEWGYFTAHTSSDNFQSEFDEPSGYGTHEHMSILEEDPLKKVDSYASSTILVVFIVVFIAYFVDKKVSNCVYISSIYAC